MQGPTEEQQHTDSVPVSSDLGRGFCFVLGGLHFLPYLSLTPPRKHGR